MEKSIISVVFITVYTDTDLHIKAKDLGKLLYKPFDNKELLDSIIEYI